MPRKGKPKSFAPGTHLFIFYYGRIHEVVVEDNQDGLDRSLVRVRFLKRPSTSSCNFVNPRGITRYACFDTAKHAMEYMSHLMRESLIEEKGIVHRHQRELNRLKKLRADFLETYKEDWPDGPEA